MQEMIGLVLNIFLHMNDLNSLENQLHQIRRLLVVYPALNAMTYHFYRVRLPRAPADQNLTNAHTKNAGPARKAATTETIPNLRPLH